MLFLGIGTGLGSAVVTDHALLPLELGHLPFKKKTFEDYVGLHGLEKHGKARWKKNVFEMIELLTAAIVPDYVVLGGGNVKKLKELPPSCIAGNNDNAFIGGFRLWDGVSDRSSKITPAISKPSVAPRRQKVSPKKRSPRGQV
jgi:polyphosphate glucokinase